MHRVGFTIASWVLLLAFAAAPAAAQSPVKFVGLGDSIGEGVQSGDASELTQPFSYVNLIAWRMGAPFPLPLIRSNLFGVVGNTGGRTRVDATVRSFNLAISASVDTQIQPLIDTAKPAIN